MNHFEKNSYNRFMLPNIQPEKKYKHYPSSTREWNNSIYIFNKNNLSLIPFASIYAMKIIKSFFSAFNKYLEKKMRTKRLLLRFRRLSSNRIYLSNGEFKHRNNSVLVNIYIFNRQKKNYLFKLKTIFLNKIFFKKINTSYKKTLRSIYLKAFNYLNRFNRDKYLLIRLFDIVKKNQKYKIKTFKKLSSYTNGFYKKILRLTMKKLRLYFLYKQLIYINRSKLNYTYLRFLKKHLETLFNKNVEFNLVNLNRFYLDGDILFESVKSKITRKRRKGNKILNTLKEKINIYKKKIFLDEAFQNKVNKRSLLEKIMINKLKYRHTTGFRLEAKGRLTRRFTASRSVLKTKYKGNILNIDSSFRNMSSIILKGNLRSNIQYIKLKSKTRIGSFGIKGWVSGD